MRKKITYHLIPYNPVLTFLVILGLLTGCKEAAPNGREIPLVTPVSQASLSNLTPSATTIPPPITMTRGTLEPVHTQTATFTLAPTLTSTITLTPTPKPHPMSIQALRSGLYPGSEITIENELERGANYRRFYAHYLSEGLKIYALLTLPDGTMPEGGWPAILFNHGYIPPKEYRTTERYIAYVDRLAQSGYIVFRIDYRGNDRSEGVASGAYYDPGYTIDVLNAVASLKRYPQANPQKLGVWGHSMGGFLALRAMVISPDIKVGVIWSGVVGSYDDLINHWHHPVSGPTPTPHAEARGGGRGAWTNQYGTPTQNPDFWNSLSATSFLDDLSGPIQLHHGTADTEVPLAFSENLAVDAKSAGKQVEFYTYPGADHNLSQSFTLAMDRTIKFFDRYLK
jgi:fermentation-respiration switch protein FrsA (DUF1100 family)